MFNFCLNYEALLGPFRSSLYTWDLDFETRDLDFETQDHDFETRDLNF